MKHGESSNTVPGLPLVKWAGGKRLLLKHIAPLVPNFGAYYEPFLGGGALFFSLLPHRSVLSDKNAELINAFRQVRDNCEALIRSLQKLSNSEAIYYRLRDERPRGSLERAVRFLYLTRLSFNGIYRLNLKGKFNVPYGRKGHLSTCDPDHLRRASTSLRSSRILLGDFEEVATKAEDGDLVYFDPPYTVAHGNNGFLKYNAKIFSWADQVRLAELSRRLAVRGVHVIVSNADHASIRNLYSGFGSVLVSRYSVISASADYRRRITESIYYCTSAAPKSQFQTPKSNSLALAHR